MKRVFRHIQCLGLINLILRTKNSKYGAGTTQLLVAIQKKYASK